MKINTKFNVGDNAFILENDIDFEKITIESININIDEEENLLITYMEGGYEYEEKDLIKSKKDVLDKLEKTFLNIKKQIGLDN